MIEQNTETKTVVNDDVTIAYMALGQRTEQAPCVCLIASTGRGPEDFLHLAKMLAKSGVRVVMPWPRGTGQSDGEDRPVTFHDLAADVEAVLKVEASGGPLIVAGHAYGCWIARCVANRMKVRVDGLVLLAAAAGKLPDALTKAINVAMKLEAGHQERLEALQLAFFAPGNDPSSWLDGWYPELALLQREARQRTDQASWWSSGSVPVLDVIGLQDPYRPESTYEYYQKELGPRVSVSEVANASHALPDEQPNKVSQQLISWIDSLGFAIREQ